jgi:uncharacterized membrane protein YeiH
MLESVLTIPFWVELAATLTGAISGAMHATKHEYDIFGVICLACVCGLAGGIIRDVLLQDYGIYAFQRPELIVVCCVVAICVFPFCKFFDKFDLPMDVLDAISVALWAIVGADKGFEAGYTVIPAAILGTITAVGGGCLRDILLARQPKIFLSGTLYALASLIGAFVFLLLRNFNIAYDLAPIIGILVVLVLRCTSVFFHVETRPARDYTDDVAAFISRVKERRQR